MNERKRLVELLSKIDYIVDDGKHPVKETVEFATDYLLENGVVVLPCKVGDMIYWNTNTFISSGVVTTIQITSSKILLFVALSGYDGKSVLYKEFDKSDIGETIFLTKEEAEQALKGGDK